MAAWMWFVLGILAILGATIVGLGFAFAKTPKPGDSVDTSQS